jgi:hypothetical protein
MKDGLAAGKLRLSRKEQQWLGRIEEALASLSADEAAMVRAVDAQYGNLYDKAGYGLAT